MRFLTSVVYIKYVFVLVAVNANHINDKKCGVVASDNPIHQHPWLVVLEYHFKRQSGGILCAGTLISSRHIITTAHCVEFGMFPIIMLPRLGEYDMSSELDCVDGVCADPVRRMVIERVFIHPGFREDRLSYDLAILVLEAEALYTDFIRPICLPTGVLDDTTVFYASGFGITPNNDNFSVVKKNIPLPYYPDCWRIYMNIPPNVLCAGGVKNFDTCRGDSGGPLVRIHERAELWGVTKGGNRHCGMENKPGVYTSVFYHLDWIQEIIEMRTQTNQNDESYFSTLFSPWRKRSESFFLLLVCCFCVLLLVFMKLHLWRTVCN